MNNNDYRQWLQRELEGLDDIFIDVKELEQRDRAAGIMAQTALREYRLKVVKEIYRLDNRKVRKNA